MDSSSPPLARCKIVCSSAVYPFCVSQKGRGEGRQIDRKDFADHDLQAIVRDDFYFKN